MEDRKSGPNSNISNLELEVARRRDEARRLDALLQKKSANIESLKKKLRAANGSAKLARADLEDLQARFAQIEDHNSKLEKVLTELCLSLEHGIERYQSLSVRRSSSSGSG